MPHLSSTAETLFLDHITGRASWTVPTNTFISLHDGHPGETGANEITGGSYARQQASWAAAASGAISTNTLETWTDMPAGDVLFWGIWTLVTGGVFYWGDPIGGTPYTFSAEDTGDVFTSYGHALVNDQRLYVANDPGGAALPSGVSEDTVYWVVGVSGDTFQVSLTEGGGAVALTADGNGIAYFIDAKNVNGGDDFEIASGNLTLRVN